MCTKSYHCLGNLKTFRIWHFVGKTDRSVKKTFWKCRKRLISQVFFQMLLASHLCSCVLKMFKTLGFWKNRCFSSEKHLKVFKNAKHGYFSLECLSKSIIAHENWKRSTAWDFRESRWVISKNCLIVLKMADISKIFIECVSNCIFAQISQNFQTLDFLGKRSGVFRMKKLEFFVKID